MNRELLNWVENDPTVSLSFTQTSSLMVAREQSFVPACVPWPWVWPSPHALGGSVHFKGIVLERDPSKEGDTRPLTYKCWWSTYEHAKQRELIPDFTYLKVSCDPFNFQGPLNQSVTSEDKSANGEHWTGNSGDFSPLTKDSLSGIAVPRNNRENAGRIIMNYCVL